MSPQRRADLLLLSVTIVWGSTFVITKQILAENSPYFYSGIRFLLASAIVFLLFARRCLATPRETFKHGAVLGVFLYVGFVIQTIGLNYTTASKAAFFTGMLVPLTPIVHYAGQHVFKLRKRLLKVGNVFGVLCAAVGLYLLTSPSGSGFNYGDFLNLLCAFFFACFIVYLDSVPPEIDKIQMTFIQFLVCAVLGLLAAVSLEEVRVTLSTGTITGFMYLVIFATVITMWVQNRFQGDTTPARAAVIFAMEPVVAAILGYLIRDEVIGTIGIVGGAIIVGGLLLSEFSDDIPYLNRTLTAREE